jgi:DNA-binding transcriptional ArsR family regulator
LVDHDLMKVLAKPQRVRVLAILDERIASPKEIAAETGEDLGSVSYHVKVLRDHGLIELERKVPRRGAVEHFYRGVSQTLLPADAWANLPSALAKKVSACIVQEFVEDASAAMEAGVFDDPPSELCWAPLVLDRAGAEEVSRLAAEFLEGVFGAQTQASRRLAAEGSTTPERISTTVFLASFLSSRSPEEGKKASAALRR